MYESSAATQKISGLDPELVSNKPHQRYDDKENNDDNNNNHSIIRDNNNNHILFGSQPQPQQVINDIKKDRGDDDKSKSVHWQYIERLLLNFDESLLDPETAFILEPHEIIDIIMDALPLIQNDETLTRIDGPVKVFGDIHGQLGDLMSLFKSFGFPDTNIGDINYYKYLFLGDFVDRGQKSLEVMCLLLSLKIEYPDRVFLLRGNHECHAMNEMYGFYHEINERVFPNIDTLKYLDNDVLNESINLIECDKELNEYNAKQEIRKQKRDKHRQEILLQLQQQGKIDEFHHYQRQFQQHDIFDFDLEFEYIEYSKTEEDEDECSSEYLSDEISSCELNFDHNNNNNKRKKIFKKRKYFRDRTDCITYLVQCIELLFRWLPLSILINDKILCVHGGIGSINNISEIECIERPCDVVCDIQQEMDSEQRKVVDLLWSDPAETDSMTGFEPNKRGVSCVFGSDVVRQFCNINNIDLIIRGHQVVKDGFEYFAGGHLITLFSATNYCNVMDNAGAILCIDEKLNVLPKLVEARQIHPNHNNDYHDDDDDDDENDNLQWKKLKQFPPSPMRGTTNNDNDDNNNNQNDNNQQDNINGDEPDKHDVSDQEFFRSIEQPNVV